MFKFLRENKGQGHFVQYSLMFFLVIGLVTVMSTYVRRAVQGRIKDAKTFMFLTANAAYADPNNNLYGNLMGAYEPYYVNREFTRAVYSRETERTLPAFGTAGIYEREYEQHETITTGAANLAPPGDAQ